MPLDLAKHTPGTPLSAAETRQRRDAARARWAIRAGVAGGVIGAQVGQYRAQSATPRLQEAQRQAADAGVTARSNQRSAGIIEAIRARTRAIGNERNKQVYDFQIAETRRRITRARPADIDELRRRMASAAPTDLPALQAQMNALVQRPASPEVVGLRRTLAHLERLKANAPVPTARSGTTRRPSVRPLRRAEAAFQVIDRQFATAQADYLREFQGAKRPERLAQLRRELETANALRTRHLDIVTNLRAAAATPVSAAVERKPKPSGETNPALERRISQVKAALQGRYRTRLAPLLERRTAQLRAVTADAVLADVERALRGRVLRGAGKGALIGAGLGLTAAGIGILAHHIAHAGEPKVKTPIAGAALTKTAFELTGTPLELTKASPDSPEGQIGKGLAETFRQWIDRLLGLNQQPINLADGFAQAMGPGIVQAFTAGAQNPPIDPASDPRAHIDVDFDVINPSVREHMATYALDRIVQISTAQREAIRDAIMKQSVLQGINPNEVARTIKESIGLTAYQRTVVESFRVGLQQLDPRVLDRKLRDARYDKTLRRAIDSNTPLTNDQINAMVDAYHRRFIALRARTIARTEALRATSFGGVARAQQVLDENPELDVIKGWLATDDEHTRCTHHNLNGNEVRGMETPFITSAGNTIRWPLDVNAVAKEVINCFPAGVQVEGSILGALRVAYDGPMVEITLKSGTQLPVTPNHPIMTPQGMIRAGALRNGMHLLRYAPDIKRTSSPGIVNDQQDGPAPIEHVFNALRVRGRGATQLELGVGDLHGDAIHGKGKIDIEWADRKLLRNFMAEQTETGRDLIFETSSVSKSSGARQSTSDLNVSPVFHPPSSSMGGGDLSSNFERVLFDFAPFQRLSIGLAAKCKASRYEAALDRGSADANFLGQLINRSAGITPDEIVDIQVQHFSGHVYDVQTVGGWTVANSIISSNCRCTLLFRFIPRRGQFLAVAA